MVIMQGSNYLIPLLIIPILLSKIGLEKYGMIVLAQGIMFMLISITDFGFNMTGTRLISQNKTNRASIITNIFLIKVALSVCSFLILFSLIQLIDKWKINESLILLSFFMVIGQAFFPVWYFQGIQKMKFILILNSISRIAYLLGILFFITTVEDALYVNVINGVAWILAALVGWGYMFRFDRFSIRKPDQSTLLLFKSNRKIFLSNISTDGYKSAGIIIAGFFFSPGMLGIYGVLEKVIQLLQNGYGAVYRAIFPAIASKVQSDLASVPSIFRKYYFNFGILTLVGVSVLLAFGAPLIAFISEELSIAQINTYIWSLSVIPLFIFIALPISVSLIAFDLKSAFLTYNFLTFSVFMVSALILMRFFSINGLLFSHIIAQGIAAIFGYVALRRHQIKWL